MARLVSERSDAVMALAEVFRTHGFEGTTLSVITAQTKMGKGSLYHFFPGGKEEMAEAVLEEIGGWFEDKVFKPLREDRDADAAIAKMFEAVDSYFRSGRRVCLVGTFALGRECERFEDQVRGYFKTWVTDLEACLIRAGHNQIVAHDLSEEVVGGIQGALVLARSLDQPAVFSRALARLKQRLEVQR
ncbi:TetR/AcrR family transcriptional regulator [Denitrobaculum tricleocarpae]|uniref:TetR/AcrR family transcriptional regulator n=1 Tax=Denitrobaculum tricleocarpae TaxID=2591009 RepID=A0A545TGF6_9PROT|nr:TetR/AcrR family transcriptional regulator [Denitrobaculum tricleocarpae]TQV76278.1 TetR/AcrR family transcriptional regulator [Denitrobaculum tricleocarpae]